MKKKPAINRSTVDPSDARYLFDPSPTHTEFMFARAHAVEEYSHLEGRLAEICALLMGVEPHISGELFFRMNNARARLEAIEELLNNRYSKRYQKFWKSLRKELSLLDQRRNQIVHWTTKKTIRLKPQTGNVSHSSLVSPKWALPNPAGDEIFLDDLFKFILKCHFFSQLLLWFRMHLDELKKATTSSWLQVFDKAATYPPSTSHPLYRDWKACGSPPQPSFP